MKLDIPPDWMLWMAEKRRFNTTYNGEHMSNLLEELDAPAARPAETSEEAEKRAAPRRSRDAELRAIEDIMNTLDDMGQAGRQRALSYLLIRYELILAPVIPMQQSIQEPKS